ncbi:acyl-CoA dehydrogenase family protein [Natrinema halophilum]|uniref:acyl-CoA dehydrogenase family protein n=1 Tax=Natrinema halophilum TaxID=1699371 RepID=UPI001F21C4FE|nr:acyl-CoA dehydrogenase family protein [Natrinema halophilum]UHQ96299.1 acyl-CoA dehydrogenase family protein [Natrinema halophilum]
MHGELAERIVRCSEIFEDRAAEVDRQASFPADNFDVLAEENLLGLACGSDFGGFDAGMAGDYQLFFDAIEEFARGCSSTAQCFATHSMAVGTIRALGSQESREFFSNEVTENGAVFGYYGSEPDQVFEGNTRTDYDTTVTRTDDGWEVSGRKFFTTNSTHADYHMAFAMKEGATDMNGLMQVVVPDDADGVTIHDTWDGMGQRSTASGMVEFEDVSIPDKCIIGDPGDLTENPYIWNSFQLSFASIFVGLARGALDFTKWYLENESKPPKDLPSLSHDPHVQLHVGDMNVRTEAASQLVERAIELLEDHHDDPDLEEETTAAVSRAKIFSSEVVLDVTNRLFQICGARSTSRQFDADRFWRNARTLVLHDVVDKQKAEVAQHELGLKTKGRYEN